MLRQRLFGIARSQPASRRLLSTARLAGRSSPWTARALTTVAAGALVFYGASTLLRETSGPVLLESPLHAASSQDNAVSSVQPDTKVDPFPTKVDIDGGSYQLLGVGVRSVSFLKFHVYAVGIYINDDDVGKLHGLVDSPQLDQASLMLDLMNPELGPYLINRLLQNGVRFSIRIVPARNTDFTHLRDGFVRSVVEHPKFKELSAKLSQTAEDPIDHGIFQLKKAFSRKRTVAKNRVLYLHRQADGRMKVEFFDAAREANGKTELLGYVDEPIISELLFDKYLTGKKPASEGCRRQSIESLAKLMTSA